LASKKEQLFGCYINTDKKLIDCAVGVGKDIMQCFNTIEKTPLGWATVNDFGGKCKTR
jgi:hypothetical protein